MPIIIEEIEYYKGQVRIICDGMTSASLILNEAKASLDSKFFREERKEKKEEIFSNASEINVALDTLAMCGGTLRKTPMEYVNELRRDLLRLKTDKEKESQEGYSGPVIGDMEEEAKIVLRRFFHNLDEETILHYLVQFEVL